MNKDLLTLYSVFDLLNNQDISTSPSMSNPATYNFYGILISLQVAIGKSKVYKELLDSMLTFLQETNHCYYQPSELRPPVRINNCPYLQICDKLLKELQE